MSHRLEVQSQLSRIIDLHCPEGFWSRIRIETKEPPTSCERGGSVESSEVLPPLHYHGRRRMTEQIDSLTEVVYSAEMAPPKTPPQDPRFDSFASDIKELKQNIEGIRGDFKSLNPMVVRIDERTSNFWTFGGIVAGFLVVWLGIISRQVFLAPPTLSTIATRFHSRRWTKHDPGCCGRKGHATSQ